MPALTTTYRMVPLQKSTQGLRLAYIYTCTWPPSRHHETDTLRTSIVELAKKSFTTLDPKKIHISFDTGLNVFHVVTGYYAKTRPSQTFAKSLERLSHDNATCYVNHCGRGDSLTFDVGPYVCLVQRLSNKNLLKTVDADGLHFKPRPGWPPSRNVWFGPTRRRSATDVFFEKLESEYLPRLAQEASGREQKAKRKRQVY
jgi:hypothetical protein